MTRFHRFQTLPGLAVPGFAILHSHMARWANQPLDSTPYIQRAENVPPPKTTTHEPGGKMTSEPGTTKGTNPADRLGCCATCRPCKNMEVEHAQQGEARNFNYGTGQRGECNGSNQPPKNNMAADSVVDLSYGATVARLLGTIRMQSRYILVADHALVQV